MTALNLPPRIRRTHLGCRVVESMRLRTTGSGVNVQHDVLLYCPRPYIATDRRSFPRKPDQLRASRGASIAPARGAALSDDYPSSRQHHGPEDVGT